MLGQINCEIKGTKRLKVSHAIQVHLTVTDESVCTGVGDWGHADITRLADRCCPNWRIRPMRHRLMPTQRSALTLWNIAESHRYRTQTDSGHLKQDQQLLPLPSRGSEGVKDIMWSDRDAQGQWHGETMNKHGAGDGWAQRAQGMTLDDNGAMREERGRYLLSISRGTDGDWLRLTPKLVASENLQWELGINVLQTESASWRDAIIRKMDRWDSDKWTVNGAWGVEQVHEMDIINNRNRMGSPITDRQRCTNNFLMIN